VGEEVAGPEDVVITEDCDGIFDLKTHGSPLARLIFGDERSGFWVLYIVYGMRPI